MLLLALDAIHQAHLRMLVDMFPRHVIEFLSINGLGAVPTAVSELASRHTDVTILFMDIVGFTPLSKTCDPPQVMMMLNELFSEFDNLCNVHNVYKVSIGI